MSLSAKERRRAYEFSNSVKEKARLIAELPNGEVHHRLPIKEARMAGIDPLLVKSQYNAVALTPEEHRRIHEEITQYEIDKLIEEFSILQPGLF